MPTRPRALVAGGSAFCASASGLEGGAHPQRAPAAAIGVFFLGKVLTYWQRLTACLAFTSPAIKLSVNKLIF